MIEPRDHASTFHAFTTGTFAIAYSRVSREIIVSP